MLEEKIILAIFFGHLWIVLYLRNVCMWHFCSWKTRLQTFLSSFLFVFRKEPTILDKTVETVEQISCQFATVSIKTRHSPPHPPSISVVLYVGYILCNQFSLLFQVTLNWERGKCAFWEGNIIDISWRSVI